ncbi:MAG: 50S ribosomal protein L30 [Chloroflexi bacterium]|nr:50S ribosomal protein L30 [Chloroflexota bacterium]
MSSLKVTWVRSGIGRPADQKATLRALGFRRLYQSLVQQDSPAVRGMLFKVRHLVHVEEVSEHETP